jgi:serine/threonine-protein kinase HipA
MAGRDPVEVCVEIAERELVAGTLWIHERGGQTATFRYADSYLASPDSYELDPVLPKGRGHRWGRTTRDREISANGQR